LDGRKQRKFEQKPAKKAKERSLSGLMPVNAWSWIVTGAVMEAGRIKSADPLELEF
jgi:hypothetical protein